MSCRTFREQAYEHVVALDLPTGNDGRVIDPAQALERWCAAASEPDLAEHGRTCVQCAGHWKRLLIQVRLLGSLSRLPAPADLEGRVVAALQPGHRQQRAIRAVSSLPHLEAPPVLARRMEAAFITKAPNALLDRVEREYEASRAETDDLRAERGTRSPMAAIVTASLVLLALWAVTPDRTPETSGADADQQLAQGEATASPYRFEIIRISSPRSASLDAATRRWVDGLSGGMLGSAD
ncbi:MAG: hypothetical protein ACI8QZ_002017 [Chlamydiales bacterium]|jgi:hypothetical protein